MHDLKKLDQEVLNDRLLNRLRDAPFLQNQKFQLQKKIVNICELFKIQVQQFPNLTAVVFNDKKTTYAELDLKSNLLANFLRKQGVKSGTVIAVSTSKNEDLIISILAIFKAGGVYLPLDPEYPIERLEYMIDDANPTLLLTHSELISKFPGKQRYATIYLDKEWENIDALDLVNISTESEIDPDSSAYIIYTSGSTGKPKGIVITYRSLPNVVESRFDLYPKQPIALLIGSISFDPTLLTILYTLISGGTLCIPTIEISSDFKKIIELIDKYSINFILCVTSFYSMLLENASELSSLEYVFVGGETLPNFLPSLHAQVAPNAYLFNEYGPAEHAIGGTIAKIYDSKQKQFSPITIGRPLPNVQIFVLDENLKPVFAGSKGEIFIGGVGLAKGYLNKDKLSAEKFIWVNIDDQEPIRLYRTGDLGRILPNGDMEFLGRIDHQIKFLGYRIELQEIESVMEQCRLVNEAIVVMQKNESERLIGFYSTSVSHDIEEEIRTHLNRLLPDYMIPSTFIRVNKWPKTPNGKLNRDGLLLLIQNPSCLPSGLPFTLSQLRNSILEIWKKVLQIESCELDDNFFDLGGSSIQLFQIQAIIYEKFGLKINIIDLFQFSTINKLTVHMQILLKEIEEKDAKQHFFTSKHS